MKAFGLLPIITCFERILTPLTTCSEVNSGGSIYPGVSSSGSTYPEVISGGSIFGFTSNKY